MAKERTKLIKQQNLAAKSNKYISLDEARRRIKAQEEEDKIKLLKGKR